MRWEARAGQWSVSAEGMQGRVALLLLLLLLHMAAPAPGGWLLVPLEHSTGQVGLMFIFLLMLLFLFLNMLLHQDFNEVYGPRSRRSLSISNNVDVLRDRWRYLDVTMV